MALDAVFFDLDGTLLDTAVDFGNALNRLLTKHDRPPLPQNNIRPVVSDGAYALLKLGFGVERSDPQAVSLREDLLSFYRQDLATHTKTFEGIDELLLRLQDHSIAWGIVTNKPVAYAEPLIEQLNLPTDPVCLVCPDHVSNSKPDPEALLLACKIASCDADRAIYIGDHRRDIQCGKNAGVKTIAVNYGYIASDDSAYHWEAEHVAEKGDDIWPLLIPYMR